MAERVQALDWSRTPLGPMEQWPQSLRTVVGTVLNAPVPMALWWGAALTMIYNDAYAPLLGKKHPEALGRSSRDVWREAWAKIEPLAEAVLRRGESVSRERDRFVLERHGRPEEAWFTWSYSPVDDGSGGIGGLLNIAYEETARVLAEREQAKEQAERERLVRELETQRARLIDLFDQSPSIVAVLRGPRHVFELANERYLELVGHRDIIGSPVREAVPEVEGQGFFELLDRVYTSGEPFVGRDVPVVLQREPGQPPEERIVDFMYQPVRDIDGNVSGILVQGVDLTDRKRVEEALRQSEARYRSLFTSIDEGFCILEMLFDRNGKPVDYRWLETNPAFERHTGLVGAVGRTARELVPGLESHWVEIYGRAAMTGNAERFEQGSEAMGRWFDVYAFRIGAPEDRRVALLFADISERKRAEEALREAKDEAESASAAKSEFLATLSHELRTPLTPVLLTVSLLESNPTLPEELREDVESIRQNVELESQLISDLLDLTRIEQGKLELDVQEVDLHLILRSAIDICQREASAKLRVDLGAERHSVRGDSTRLRQVFWNLIGNAVKFTPPEGTITVRSLDAPDGHIRVEVADTGQGIDPAVLPRLFTAFEQGESRASRPMAGLGLGLAISRKLAEAHGGTITARSEGRGRGSTFTVELPAVEADVISPIAEPRGQAGSVQSLRVLLVEDHEPTLRVMKKLLRHLGHQVSGVSSVAEATAAAKQDRFDLMICDLGLPDGSGLDVMRQLREHFNGKAIALTGYGMESDIAASRAAGFAEHLTKPVDLAALKAAIGRVAGGAGM